MEEYYDEGKLDYPDEELHAKLLAKQEARQKVDILKSDVEGLESAVRVELHKAADSGDVHALHEIRFLDVLKSNGQVDAIEALYEDEVLGHLEKAHNDDGRTYEQLYSDMVQRHPLIFSALQKARDERDLVKFGHATKE